MMIKEIRAWDEYINFINSFMEDESFSDPHMVYSQDNLWKALGGKDQKVYAVLQGDQLFGIFVLMILKDDQYIEMIAALSRERKAYLEILDFMEENYADYKADFVFNPKNHVLKAVLEENSARIDPEQMVMRLEKELPYEKNQAIQLLSDEYVEQYVTIHSKDVYWTGDKVIKASNLFRVFLALKDNEVIGYADVSYGPKGSEVYDLFVKEQYEFQEYGQLLLAEAIEANKPDKMDVFLEVCDTKSITLYESLGFEPVKGHNSVYASYKLGEAHE